MHAAIDFILKIDERLFSLAETYGAWVYGILFLIVFAETGLIVAPILPGDSLLFAAGALCGAGLLNPWIMATLLIAAAIIGDAVNYSVGRSLGVNGIPSVVGPVTMRAVTPAWASSALSAISTPPSRGTST